MPYTLKRRFQDQLLTTSVYYEDKIIAMGLYFTSGGIIHDHLNGTRAEYLQYSPAYLLKYTMLQWAEENGFSIIHYGGGVSNAPEDSVLKFKKRFSKNTAFEFYTGRKIWNEEIYDELCKRNSVIEETEFFPAYRAPQLVAEEI